MTTDDKSSSKPSNPLGFVLNEKGEEVPITEEMVKQSMEEAKLQSIGAHTGHHKIITDDMIKKENK
ncbi:MAG: hypothetical protein ACRBCS_06170 [Cellvibrionaceae bacterium]